MNARTAALLLILSAVALTPSCSWNPFRSQPTQSTQSTQPVQAQTPADTSAAPASQSSSSTSDAPRGVWPTTTPPPVTGKEIDDGREKKSCTTAQRLRWDC
jgi:hypothetical protein